MTWEAATIRVFAGSPAGARARMRSGIADEDDLVVGLLGRVEERPRDDLLRTVVAAHRVDRQAHAPGMLDSADGGGVHQAAGGRALRRTLVRTPPRRPSS